MSDADNKYDDLILQDRIYDHIILAGMDAAEFGIALKLTGRSAKGIFGKQANPTRYAIANMLWKILNLTLSLAGKLDRIRHLKAPVCA